MVFACQTEMPNWEGFAQSGFSQIGNEARFVFQEKARPPGAWALWRWLVC